jgi:hypothetical protein
MKEVQAAIGYPHEILLGLAQHGCCITQWGSPGTVGRIGGDRHVGRAGDDRFDQRPVMARVAHDHVVILLIDFQHGSQLLLGISADPPVHQLSADTEDAIIYSDAHACPDVTEPG